jgi:chromosome segregation ATPase
MPADEAKKLVKSLAELNPASAADVEAYEKLQSAPPPPPAHEKQAAEIEQLKGQIRHKDYQIGKLTEIANTGNTLQEVNTLKGKLGAAEERIAELEATDQASELEESAAKLEAAEACIRELESRISTLLEETAGAEPSGDMPVYSGRKWWKWGDKSYRWDDLPGEAKDLIPQDHPDRPKEVRE